LNVAGHIVAVDSVSPTVFCISETGDLIRWFDCSDYMREPSDIAISGKEYFVCDFKVSSLLLLFVLIHEAAVEFNTHNLCVSFGKQNNVIYVLKCIKYKRMGCGQPAITQML